MTSKPPERSAPRPRTADAPTALSGIRIADFSHFIAGPYATMMLADFGAEVIKVENSDGGDGFRAYPPLLGTEGVPYLWVNRNKKSVALDLKSQAGQQIALDLIATCDVLVENFSTGVMARFGLDYDRVAKRNPGLVYCSVSAYGRTGAYAHRVGFDPIAQAESGFMSMNGYPENEPVRAGPSFIDISTALMACNAIQAALHARARTGKGQYVEVNMITTAVNMLGNFSLAYLATGVNPTRFGNTQTTACPVGAFHTADAPLYLACANDRTYARLVSEVFGMPAMATDARYRSSALRRENQAELMKWVGDQLRQRPRAEWLGKMHAVGVPAGAIRTVEEAMCSDELAQLGVVSDIPHPALGSIPNVGLPISLSATPLCNPVAAPMIGADTERVLKELPGFDSQRIATLLAQGVIGSRH